MNIEKPARPGDRARSELKISRRKAANRIGLILGTAFMSQTDQALQLGNKLFEDMAEGRIQRKLQALQREISFIEQKMDRDRIANAINEAIENHHFNQPLSDIELENLIIAISAIETGVRNRPRALNRIPVITEDLVNKFSRDTAQTTGIMQSDLGARQHNPPTIEESFDLGTFSLTENLRLYHKQQPKPTKLQVIKFALADYHAGRGSCLRAGLQQALYEAGHYSSEETVMDGRIGDKTIAALISFFEERRHSEGAFNKDNYDEYLLEIQRAHVEENPKLWGYLKQSLQIQPQLPDISHTSDKKVLMRLTGEPVTNSEYVEAVLNVYRFLSTN